MRLVLAAIHIEESPRAVPLGAAMLASSLKKSLSDEVQTNIVDLYLNQSPAECAEILLNQNPNCIGFSTYVWNRTLTLQIANLIRADKPEIILFAGGPEISADKDELKQLKPFDFLLPGESELTITQAMRHLLDDGAPEAIPDIIKTGVIQDLESLPSPILDGTLDPNKYSGMLWELSRGCPFKCDFCYESRGTPGIRRFSTDRIRQELKIFSKAGVEQIFVLDPTFNFHIEKAKEMLQMILKEAPEIYYFFEVRSEFIDEELAALFASLNCSLQIGMQSSSNDVLKSINRSIDTEDFANKMLLLHEAGAGYGFDLIYGLPGDTLAGFCASLDYAMSLAPNHIDIFPLTVLPGTKLHDTAPSFKLEHLKDNPYTVISSPSFNKTDMIKATELAKAFSIFYNEGKAIPWFDIILSITELSPSAFSAKLSEWMKANDEKDVMTLQKRFITHLYDECGKGHLSALACDIITYFGAIEAVSEADSCSFSYNPTDLIGFMEDGTTELEDLYSIMTKDKCEFTIDQLI